MMMFMALSLCGVIYVGYVESFKLEICKSNTV